MPRKKLVAPLRDGPLRYVIYARVSTKKRAQELSCDNQIAECRQWCAYRNYAVVGVYKDEGISGGSMDRPGWLQVEKDLVENRADCVISTALDRMTRNVEGFLRFIREVVEPYGKNFETRREEINTSSAGGKMFLHMLLAFAQFYKDLNSEKTSAAMHTRALDGYHPTRPPFGTMKGSERGVPVKDPERWPWLEKIFEMAASCKTNTEILLVLSDNAVRTRAGSQLNHSTLNRLLASRFFLGEVCTEVDGEEAWFPGRHACRIDQAMWNAAQRTRKAKPGPPQRDYIYLLDGLLVTSHYVVSHPRSMAGRPLPYRTKKNTARDGSPYHAYMMAGRDRKFGGVEAEPVDDDASVIPPYIRAQELDGMVVQELLRLYKSGELQQGLADAMASTVSLLEKLRADRREISTLLERLLQKEERLNRKVIELIDKELDNSLKAVDTQLASLGQELAAAKIRLAACEASIREVEQAARENASVPDQIAMLERAWKDGYNQGLRSVLLELVKEVDLRHDGAVISVYAMPQKAVCEFKPEAALSSLTPKLLRA